MFKKEKFFNLKLGNKWKFVIISFRFSHQVSILIVQVNEYPKSIGLENMCRNF